MFETDAPPVTPTRVVRVPMAALAARPEGIAVAAGVVDLAETIARASAARSASERDSETEAEAELVDALSCWERAKSTAEARQLRTMADLARRPMFAGCAEHGDQDPEHGIRAAASVVSAQLRISPGHARNRVELACELVECLPDTLAALAAGRIDGYRARVLVEETRPLANTPELRTQVEAELLVKAGQQTGAQLRAAARRAVVAADPSTAEERHTRARAGRGIGVPIKESDGMASCLIRMAAEDLAAFWAAMDSAARRAKTDNPDDPRTLDQLRADTLADLCWSALDAGHLGCCNPACSHVNQPFGTRHGRAATVGVTVPITTLLGVDDQPAHLQGYGPITADVARRIAADGTWRRLLTDPVTGALLDTAPPDTRHPLVSSSTSTLATAAAASPPAPTRPRRATPITPLPLTPADRQPRTTSGRCTAGTIMTRPITAGGWTNLNRADSSGPHRPDTSTRSTPRSSGH
jgi:hypothetical protein